MSGIDLEYSNWMELATHDFNSAEMLINKTEYFDIVVYHIHQAAEKMLKAFIVKNKNTYKRIHDLDKLLKECMEFDDSFSSIANEILFIHSYLGKVRYPFGEKITEDEARECFNKAKIIIEAVKNGG